MTVSPLQSFIWQVRREFWEHRSIVFTPAILLGILFLVMLTGAIKTSGVNEGVMEMGLSAMGGVETEMVTLAIKVAMLLFGAVFIVAMSLVSMFYLLDSLYAERRDRSVLFWKSLPLSDTSTVLSKFFVGAFAIPLVAIVGTLVAYLLFVLIASFKFGGVEGFPLLSLWNPLSILQALVISLEQTVCFSLWFLPIFSWFLLCSVAVRKVPFLCAIGIPALIMLVEVLLFGESAFSSLIVNHASGFATSQTGESIIANREALESVFGSDIDIQMGDEDGAFRVKLFKILQQPALYAGWVVSAVFVSAAIWWRRNRIELG